MSDRVACLKNGRVLIVQDGREPVEIESPYAEQFATRERAQVRRSTPQAESREATSRERSAWWGRGTGPKLPPARIVGLTRGRVADELCYAIKAGAASGIFAQRPGTREEHRLFHDAEVELLDLDFSFANDAFTCTVVAKGGTSSIGVLADDGKGVRTVTEGDVLDRGPRWVPGGRGQILYASAGVGRTKAGIWAGRSPFSLHRLRLEDSTVEVLVSDAQYDYVAPVPISDSLIYAIRRPYEDAKPKGSLATLGDALRSPFRPLLALFQDLSPSGARATGKPPLPEAAAPQGTERMLIWEGVVALAGDATFAPYPVVQTSRGYELVRITPKATEVIAEAVIAFDVAPNGDIIYSDGSAVFRMSAAKGSQKTRLSELDRVEQIVIC